MAVTATTKIHVGFAIIGERVTDIDYLLHNNDLESHDVNATRVSGIRFYIYAGLLAQRKKKFITSRIEVKNFD